MSLQRKILRNIARNNMQKQDYKIKNNKNQEDVDRMKSRKDMKLPILFKERWREFIY